MPEDKAKQDNTIMTTSVRIPRWMNRMVEHDAADRSIGKSDVFQLALRKWFKISESK